MIKIAITDDQRLFRQSLRYLLESDPFFSVTGEACDGQELFSIMNKAVPDIVLMDINMPKLNGIAATRIITDRWPQVKVIMLSVSDEDDMIAASMAAGAKGYILKDAEKEEFIRIIKNLHEGKTTLSPYLANTLMNPGSYSVEGNGERSFKRVRFSLYEKLTNQEKKIADLLAAGRNNKEIADLLCISLDTVKTHIKRIFKKLDVTSRTQAVVKLLQG